MNRKIVFLGRSLAKYTEAGENIGLVNFSENVEIVKYGKQIKQKLKQKNKQIFIFISDNIDTDQFENFNIGSFINTACSGLSLDSPSIINYNELPKE